MWISVEVEVKATPEQVWKAWTTPEAITQWNFAIDTWHCPHASVDLRVGGKMNSRMEARDGSMGFDFWGTFSKIETHQLLEIDLGDDRKVIVKFAPTVDGTKVIEKFEAEDQNSAEMQRQGWQSILNNFKNYVESIA